LATAAAPGHSDLGMAWIHRRPSPGVATATPIRSMSNSIRQSGIYHRRHRQDCRIRHSQLLLPPGCRCRSLSGQRSAAFFPSRSGRSLFSMACRLEQGVPSSPCLHQFSLKPGEPHAATDGCATTAAKSRPCIQPLSMDGVVTSSHHHEPRASVPCSPDVVCLVVRLRRIACGWRSSKVYSWN